MKIFHKFLCIVLCITLITLTPGCSKKHKKSSGSTSGYSTGSTQGGSTSAHGGTNTTLSQDGVDYLVENGILKISGSGTVTKDAVASMLAEYNIVEFDGDLNVGDDAFNGYKNITHISLFNSVNEIGARAFKGCVIPLIALGSNITSIGDEAFKDCYIEAVFINNQYIMENFDDASSFGCVGENAQEILVHHELIPLEADDDYTRYESIVGDYLNDNGFFEALTTSTGRYTTMVAQGSMYKQYHERQYGFFELYRSDVGRFENFDCVNISLDKKYGYNEETNDLKYETYATFWAEKNIDVKFYNVKYLPEGASPGCWSITEEEPASPPSNSQGNDGGYDNGGSDSGDKSYECSECYKNGDRLCQGHPCGVCSSTGWKRCSGCGGTGQDPLNKYTNYKCVVCGGTGEQICPNCEGAKKIFNKNGK